MNKKGGISPFLFTIILIICALLFSGILMKFIGKYNNTNIEEDIIIIKKSQIDEPLKELQIRYIKGEIEKVDYILEERKQICPTPN